MTCRLIYNTEEPCFYFVYFLCCITVIVVSLIEFTSFCSYIYTFLANRCFFAISVAYVVLQQLVWFAYLSGLDGFKIVK